MPLRSMTGFGQAESSTPCGTYRVEIRGVNGRYLDIQLRVPRSFANLEADMKKAVSQSIARGSVTLMVSWEREDEQGGLTWDKDKVATYVRIFREIKDTHKLAGDVTLENLLSFSDLLKVENEGYDDKLLWKHAKPVIDKAVKDFIRSREHEAALIAVDLKKMTTQLTNTLGHIERRAPARLKTYRTTLKEKVESLSDGSVEPQRLATELAIMADRLDISEECTRLHAHIDKFDATFQSKEPVGKRMNFILQEMNREANTIASKANDTKIAHLSVSLRESIEKIREQIQNIE